MVGHSLEPCNVSIGSFLIESCDLHVQILFVASVVTAHHLPLCCAAFLCTAWTNWTVLPLIALISANIIIIKILNFFRYDLKLVMALFAIQGSDPASHGCNFPPPDCRVGVGFKPRIWCFDESASWLHSCCGHIHPRCGFQTDPVG